MKPGIQISSFRPLLTSPEGVSRVFAETARMGCDTVQLQWIDMSVSPEVIVREMNRFGIRSVSTQDFYETVQEHLDYFIQLNHLCKSRWVCVSKIPEAFAGPRGLADFSQQLALLKKRLETEDLELCFHPRGEDFALTGGLQPVQYLMEQDGLDLSLCLDLYHVHWAGLSLADTIRRYTGRVCMVHFKDFRQTPKGPALVPVGQGDIRWEEAVNACLQTRVPFGFVEQEQWEGDPFRCLQESYDWLGNALRRREARG